MKQADNLKHTNMNGREKRMNIWIPILIIVAWFLLQAFILPKLGIST